MEPYPIIPQLLRLSASTRLARDSRASAGPMRDGTRIPGGGRSACSAATALCGIDSWSSRCGRVCMGVLIRMGVALLDVPNHRRPRPRSRTERWLPVSSLYEKVVRGRHRTRFRLNSFGGQKSRGARRRRLHPQRQKRFITTAPPRRVLVYPSLTGRRCRQRDRQSDLVLRSRYGGLSVKAVPIWEFTARVPESFLQNCPAGARPTSGRDEVISPFASDGRRVSRSNFSR